MSFRHLKISTRLALGFALLIATMLTIVVVGLLQLGSLLETNRQIIDSDWVKADAANTLSSIAQANARRTIEIYFADTDAQRAQKRAEIVGGRETFVQAFKTLQGRNERGDFTGQGIPAIPALKKLVEFSPEKKEVETLWTHFIEEQASA